MHVCVDVYACVCVLPSVHLCVCDFFLEGPNVCVYVVMHLGGGGGDSPPLLIPQDPSL